MTYINKLNGILTEYTDLYIVELSPNKILLSNGKVLTTVSDIRKLQATRI